jgi:aromatic ring-opening dioxygenase catalytic subunit (LigB family)
MGAALEPLRSEGVLIVGSGESYHNLRAFGPAGAEISQTFDNWLTNAVEIPDAGQRNIALTLWDRAPAARLAHPREEHLIPLMVTAGAAGQDAGRRVYGDKLSGLAMSAYRFG